MHSQYTTHLIPSVVTYRPIEGFPGYEVGDDGEVWSCWSNAGRMIDRWRRIKGGCSTKGYLQVCLRRDGNTHKRLVHRLVLAAFVGPCPEGMECLHGNGNPSDNRLGNLNWGTPKENQADSLRHGTAFLVPGEVNPRAKLTGELVRRIAEARIATGFGATAICKMLDVPIAMKGAVREILRGRSWTHATGFTPESPRYAQGK